MLAGGRGTRPSIMREGLLGRLGVAARPAGHDLGTMDLVAGMEVGAEIEVTEDGALEELPLHLENAQNCLSWDSLDISSSDEDGDAHLTCLPVRRLPGPAQRRPVPLPGPPSAAKLPACEKWMPPLFSCPLRPGGSPPPSVPAFDTYQCQKCLQVFMEEWHYTQHLQDHVQEEEEEAQRRAAQTPARPPSPPRKLRCLECGKRFLHPEHFARHTKWHLRLVRLGIRVRRKKGSRLPSQASYVYKPFGATRSPSEGQDAPGLLVTRESLSQPSGLPGSRLQRASRRKSIRHQRRMRAEAFRDQELLSSAQTRNSVVDGVHLLQPWPKQGPVLEGQGSGGLFPPPVINAENQIIILDREEAEAMPVALELQTAIIDSQGDANAVQPVFLRADEPAVLLDTVGSLNPPQLGRVKEQAALTPEWLSQNPCTVFRTVLLQAEQATPADSQADPGPFQQVIIRTSEGSPTLYLDPDPQLSALDPASFHFVPEPEYITLPYENSLTLDHIEVADDGGKAWEPHGSSFHVPSDPPGLGQQTEPPPPATAGLRSPAVVRLLPCPPGDHPEVLDLEYDTGGGIPVASEPWDAGRPAEPEGPEQAAEESFIVVEMEGESGHQGLVVGGPYSSPGRRTSRPLRRNRARRFKCPDCGVRYSRLSQLRSHQKGQKRRGRSYLCECGAPFRGLLHLLRHQLQHLEEALFICATCGKSLKGHTGLERHSSCHSGPACYGCSCGSTFRRLSRYLWHHVRSQRPGLRVYTLSGFLSSP